MFFATTVKVDAEDAVVVAVVGNNEILIATARTDRGYTNVIGVHFFDVSFPNMKFFG